MNEQLNPVFKDICNGFLFGAKKEYTHNCSCGMPLAKGEKCKRNHKPKRELIGVYSGQSRQFKGKYEDR
jgi:hypothetical protein